MAVEKEPFKLVAHNFNFHATGTAYKYCVYCGLVAMKNEFSQWAIKQGCMNKDHPSYELKRQLTNPFK